MKLLTYNNQTYLIARKDVITVAMRPSGDTSVEFLTIYENGEITVKSKRVEWLNERLKTMYPAPVSLG